MAKLSLRGASKLFDVSRAGLEAALKAGRISGAKNADGRWTIDAAELSRVYKPRPSAPKPEIAPEAAPDPPPPAAEAARPTVDMDAYRGLEADLARALAERDLHAAVSEERGRALADLRRLLPPPQMIPARWWSRLVRR